MVRRVIDVPPVDRLAVVSRLILSANNDASKICSALLQNATSMVRINVPVDQWLPEMVAAAKDENPCCSGALLPRGLLPPASGALGRMRPLLRRFASVPHAKMC